MNQRECDLVGFTEFGPYVVSRDRVDQIVEELHAVLVPRTLFQRAVLYDEREVIATLIGGLIRYGAVVTSHVEHQQAIGDKLCCSAQVETSGTMPFPTAHAVELSDGDPAIWVWGFPEIIHRQPILDAMRHAIGAACDEPLVAIKSLPANVIASLDVVVAIDESNDLVGLVRTALIDIVRPALDSRVSG